jgi:vitamin B12 transporter
MKTTLTLLLALAAAPAWAQSNPDQPTTDANGDTIVVTATRSGDAIPTDLLGASVTVIDPQAIEQRQARVLSDVLRDVPGVAVNRIGAVGGQTQIRLRGAEANQTLVLIDGIEVSDPSTSEFDFGTLLADPAARVEVLRGQQSSLYGSDAIGGVINYITSTGAEAPGISLRAEGGSMGTVDGAARMAGVKGDLDYALTGTALHTRGYPTAEGGSRNVGADQIGLSGKAIWAVAPNFHITAVGRYSYSDADTNDSDATSVTIDTPGVHYHNRGLYGLLRAQLDLLDGRFTNALTAQVADTKRTDYDVPDTSSPREGQSIEPTFGTHGRRIKGSYEGAFHFGTDDIKQVATVAVDAKRESERTTIDIFEGVPSGFLGWRHTNNVGLVGEYDLTVHDRLAIGASVRHDWNNRFADPTTYRVQASYKLDTGTRIHAAAGSGVKDPTFGELFDFFAGQYIGNPNLKPEKSHGWEAGVEQSFFDRHIVLDATYFDNRLKDEITTTFTADGSTSINLPGHTRQRGVEVSAAARLGDGWRIDAAYTYLHAPQPLDVTLDPAAFLTDTIDVQGLRRAKNIASLNIGWAPPHKRFSANAGVRYNGPQNDQSFATFPGALVRLHGYTLVNMDATYNLTDKVQIFGRVENQLNAHYQEVFTFATPGRAGYGGVRVTF